MCAQRERPSAKILYLACMETAIKAKGIFGPSQGLWYKVCGTDDDMSRAYARDRDSDHDQGKAQTCGNCYGRQRSAQALKSHYQHHPRMSALIVRRLSCLWAVARRLAVNANCTDWHRGVALTTNICCTAGKEPEQVSILCNLKKLK